MILIKNFSFGGRIFFGADFNPVYLDYIITSSTTNSTDLFKIDYETNEIIWV
jgi:hypothetical protein